MNYYGKKRTPFYFIIDFDFSKALVLTENEINKDKVIFSFYSEAGKSNKNIVYKVNPVSVSVYNKAFGKVQDEIKTGNTYLINLTFSSEIEGNINLKRIFDSAAAPYKLYLEDSFTVFSPETFIKTKGGKIYSYPMKGTIDADIPNAEQIILNNKKETAEHYTIVDLIRNDLNQVAENVKVESFRYIDKIISDNKNLLQVSSKISGVLPKNFNEQIGTILSKLLPAGSISGAPKRKTVEIIKSAETHNRGFYTGIAGYFNGYDIDSFVMIRYIEKVGDQYFFKSGGGITGFSNMKSEYREMCDKIYIPK